MQIMWKSKWTQYVLMTIGTIIITIGVYFFKFPNNFSFGGVTGIAVVVSRLVPWSASTITLVLNMLLLVVGFLFLGKKFGIKTVYVTVLMSLLLAVLEVLCPMTQPLTDQLFLEFVLAILLPSFGAAILFNVGASGGGTDIVAMILRRRTGLDMGTMLFVVDIVVTVSVFAVFDIETSLYAVTGLMAKTIVINGSISDLNLSKYFNIICDDPEPICAFIKEKLHRGATVTDAYGAFSHHDKYIVFTVISRSQAIRLRNFVKQVEPHAFMAICNSSEIIGKGFQE